MVAKGNQPNNTGGTVPSSVLLNKKVKLRPVKRMSVNTDRVNEASMLTGTSRSLICPIDPQTGRYKDPLNLKEREYLESILHESFDIYAPNCFWHSARVFISKNIPEIDEVYHEFDLSTPTGYAMYKMALVCDEVATTKMDVYPLNKLFFMDDEEVEVTTKAAVYEKIDFVNEFKFSIKNNRKQLYDFVRTFNQKSRRRFNIAKDAPLEAFTNYISEVLEDKKGVDELYDHVTYVKSDAASYELDLFIQDALQIGEVQKTQHEYKLADGTGLGKALDDVKYYFSNPANIITKERIMDQIKLNLK